MHPDIFAYHQKLAATDRDICDALYRIISAGLPEAENKVWHGHPVWFIEGNPIVGYDRLKANLRLMFWSGRSFEEQGLQNEGNFQTAGIRYTSVEQINEKELMRWLAKSRDIQWDYKNIIRRKGKLERLK